MKFMSKPPGKQEVLFYHTSVERADFTGNPGRGNNKAEGKARDTKL